MSDEIGQDLAGEETYVSVCFHHINRCNFYTCYECWNHASC